MTTVKELRDRAKELGIKGAAKMAKGELEERIKARQAGEFAPIQVPGSKGSVTVSRVGDTITVRWLCGAERKFAPEDLATAIERFESITRRGLWYEDTDSHTHYYAACLRDGQFHGDESVDGRQGTVPWDEFKAALQASLT